MKKLILIDGNALVHRAFHALPPLTSPKGVVTNAVFGFNSILIKIIKEMKPDYIAATFDLAGPTFRHEEFAEYKLHRQKAPQELYDQIPLVKDSLGAFGIPVYEMPGYEADDLIGTLAVRAKQEPDLQVVIATGDLDTLQLVDNKKVVVFTLRKGVSDTVVYDEDAVFDRYGLKPEQLNDYRGLKGDPSDNIPGVPGIGEKTAADLIQKFGSLDKLYECLEAMTEKDKSDKLKEYKVSEKLAEKLIINKDQAFFSKQLSSIVTDLEVDFDFNKSDWRKNANLSKIEKVFHDLGFSSLLKRLPEIGITAQASLDIDSSEKTEDVASSDETDKVTFYVAGFDVESDLKKILSDGKRLVVGHELKKFFKEAIKKKQNIINPVFDTSVAAYLISPDSKDYSFQTVYYSEFGNLPVEDLKNMPAQLSKLRNSLEEKLKSLNLVKVFEDIEMPLLPVLAEMESNGISVDTDILADLLKSSNKELNKLEKNIYKFAGQEFNINSPQQLSEILFVKLGIKGRVRKTAGGALSTAAPELEKLREGNPIIDSLLEYRELQKLKTTYIEPFPALVDSEDHRVHTTYNQTGAGTGRLSSENPNLQNIPIKTELGQEFRKAFVAANDYTLVSCDYSQIELRIAAHIAGDSKMIDVFRRGEDIHTATASEVFGVSLENVDKEMRRQAKALNFGILFGMGSVGFARATGVTTQRAREFITKYFNDFPGIAKYMNNMKEKAHRDGYVETILGRRRPIADIYSTMPQVQAQAERMAINHPIQGTEADIMKLAMIAVFNYINKNFEKNDARLLLQVHDELVFEIKDNLFKKVSPELKKIMESVHKLDVPLVVDVKCGKNWQEMDTI